VCLEKRRLPIRGLANNVEAARLQQPRRHAAEAWMIIDDENTPAHVQMVAKRLRTHHRDFPDSSWPSTRAGNDRAVDSSERRSEPEGAGEPP
jgi:hypothetical protein